MPQSTSDDPSPIRLLPVVMPAPTAVSLGDWQSRGSCVGEDPEIFFPVHGAPASKARKICAACPVKDRCLQYAIDADEFGIWAGLDQDERRNSRRRQRRRQAYVRGKTTPPEGTA
jgi:WhiB family redox-sensing transcriptional regulator